MEINARILFPIEKICKNRIISQRNYLILKQFIPQITDILNPAYQAIYFKKKVIIN